jgi:hypothetical protein
MFDNYKDYIDKQIQLGWDQSSAESILLVNLSNYHELQHIIWSPDKDYIKPTLEELCKFSLLDFVIDKFK